jgi:hypothetical protein
MARSTSWMPLALGVILVGAVVVLSRVASQRVGEGLRGVAQRIPDPPDKPGLEAGPDIADPSSATRAGRDEGPGDPDEPRIDLEYPTERDWYFLEEVMATGAPEARRSAAKALVVMGDMRGVATLFDAAAEQGPDADLFCLAALAFVRPQRWEDTLPTLLGVMLEEDTPVSMSCRSEVSDRFSVAGGRDAELLATLAGHDDPDIRGFVAAFLLDVDPVGYREQLERLARDPEPTVRARAGGSDEPPPDPQGEER